MHSSLNAFLQAIPGLFLLFFIFYIGVESNPTYLHHFCDNDTTMEQNSSYETNLNLLLSSFSSNANSSNGFYNTTIGQQPPDTIYGLFLCRGDVTSDICQDCVTTAATNVTNLCPVGKSCVIRYDKCMLRYSNQYFFAAHETSPTELILKNKTVTEDERFIDILSSVVIGVTMEAAEGPVGAEKFATKEAKLEGSQTLYSLAQCTPDLSSFYCDKCLQTATSHFLECCASKQGVTEAILLSPSCNVRYQLSPFYNKTSGEAQTRNPGYTYQGKRGMSSHRVITIVVPTISTLVLSIFLCCVLGMKARKKIISHARQTGAGSKFRNMPSLQFDWSIIEDATNNFAEANKIGSGGFGSVYKGMLPNGQEIAVKRLSATSGQGDQEFENELVLVAKLQHRNLVKLLGYCLEREERMLVYEFVPNKSLDSFRFDHQGRLQLDWPKRFKIIKGIAKGLLYIHSDSRLKIIHRDLKAGNVLLDENLTPKIADFGLAKIINGANISMDRTKRIAGTYGYISPEYAMHGRYSEKPDVFSFGVLLLEIISGKQNTSFCRSGYADNLLTYARRHWKNGMALGLMDSTLQDSYLSNEVHRCIQIGLLCVQENPDPRPKMARVAAMLSSFSVTLPLPQKPAFFFGTITANPMLRMGSDHGQSTSPSSSFTVNEASLTELFPR